MTEVKTINITICMGSSCFARGNAENLAFIEDFVKRNSLNANIDLCGSRCEGNCATGPNIIINSTAHSDVTPEKLAKILNELLT